MKTRSPHDPLGLLYHMVSDRDLPHVKHLYPYKTAADFETDLRYLRDHYFLASYRDLLLHVEGRKPLPRNAAIVSFDDGFAECYTVARPLLLEYRVPCIFFLTTSFLDNRRLFYRCKVSLCIETLHRQSPTRQSGLLEEVSRSLDSQTPDLPAFADWILRRQATEEPLIDRTCRLLDVDVEGFLRSEKPFLTTDQIREMRGEGFDFGAHSRTHARLTLLPRDAQGAEVVESCRGVARLTGENQVPFAFPFSGKGVDAAFLASLRDRHPQVGLLFDTASPQPCRLSRVERIWVDRPVPGVPASQNLAHWVREAHVRARRD